MESKRRHHSTSVGSACAHPRIAQRGRGELAMASCSRMEALACWGRYYVVVTVVVTVVAKCGSGQLN